MTTVVLYPMLHLFSFDAYFRRSENVSERGFRKTWNVFQNHPKVLLQATQESPPFYGMLEEVWDQV